MGNTNSNEEVSPLFYGEELSLKSGSINSSIPLNHSVETYENLKLSPAIKQTILRNIDSDDLVNSLLPGDLEDSVTLDGISSYQSPKSEDMEILLKELKSLENATVAGIPVKLSEALKALERHLTSSFQLESLPHLISLQKRLCIFREMQACIFHERKLQSVMERKRKWSEKSLNSIEHPSLSAVVAFTDFGVEVLEFLPMLIDSMVADKDVGNKSLKPLLRLCQKFAKFPNLCFFDSWSPRIQPPLKKLDLSKAVATATEGEAKNAIDNNPTTAWTSVGSCWTLRLAEVTDIDWIRISWVSQAQQELLSVEDGGDEKLFDIGAPERFAVFVRFRVVDPITGSIDETKPTHVKTIEPEKEKKTQGSWVQYYRLSLKNVKSIKLIHSRKLCSVSTAKACTIYDFSCFRQDTENMLWVDNIKLFNKIQKSFFLALQLSSMQATIISTNLNILRCTGSLNLFLSFISFFLGEKSRHSFERDELLAQDLSNDSQVVTRNAYDSLLHAIHQKESDLMQVFNNDNCLVKESILNTVTFSSQKKSNNITIVNKLELKADDWKSGYCALDFTFKTGVTYEWEVEIESNPNELESKENSLKGIRIGLAELKSGTELNQANVEAFSYLIDLNSGNLYEKTSNPISSRKIEFSSNFLKANRKSLRFTFDGLSSQLLLSVDDQNFGVLFENIPTTNMYPIVFLEDRTPKPAEKSEEEKKEEHIPPPCEMLRLTNFQIVNNPRSSLLPLAPRKLDIPVWSTAEKYAIMLLKELSTLATTMITCFQTCISPAKERNLLQGNLEYPFCLEISLEVFAKASSILSIGLETGNTDIIISILKILELQFLVLNKSKMNLQSIEHFTTDIDSQHSSESERNIITKLSTMLKEVLLSPNQSNSLHSHSEETIGMISLCYARGYKLFLPSAFDRVTQIHELLKKDVSPFQNSSSVSKFSLIEMLLETVSDLESISELVSSFNSASCDNSSLEALASVLSLLFEWIYDSEKEALFSRTYYNPETPIFTGEKALFIQGTVAFLTSLLEELISKVTSLKGEENELVLKVLTHFVKEYLKFSLQLLTDAASLNNTWCSGWDLDLFIKQCFLISSLHSVLYSLTLETLPVKVIESLTEVLQKFVSQVALLAHNSSICSETLNLISLSIPRKRSGKGSGSGVGGWKQIKATFEEGESSYSISDNGTTYTSVHSSNTCALVNFRFTSAQRGAWEFLLDQDSLNDECSVFGAARQPLRSRCYSSSNDLWMRRSYNGYMYCQGSTTGNNMDKIHPGDIIRMEWNGPEGTLSFSVNGSEPEVGFSDITDDIYPACGSYRNGIVVKLLKVELYSTGGGSDDEESVEEHVPSKSIWWSLPESLINFRDNSILQHNPPKEKNKSKKVVTKWLTARGTRGALEGVHDWEFQVNDTIDGPWSIGVVVDHTPLDSDRLAAVKPESRKHNKENILSFAWNSDGSLWCDGEKVSSSYGLSAFPLRKYSTVKIRINRMDSTISYFVNGKYLGVACGPAAFHSAFIISENRLNKNKIIYPAASIYHQNLSMKIVAAGMETSIAIPFLHSLTHSSTSVLGRICARLIQGTNMDSIEKGLMEWLRSAIFSGGIDSTFLDATKLEALPENSLSELQSKISEVVRDDIFKRDITPSEKFLLEIAHGFNLNQEDSLVSKFYEWLEKIDAEPPMMRKALERTNNYRFPLCELPFVACLLKHSGMIEEAFLAAQSLQKNEIRPPSEEMFLLWQKVKQLRTNLRRKKQHFKAISPEIANMNSNNSSEIGSSAEIVTEDVAEISSESKEAPVTPEKELELRFGKASFGYGNQLTWRSHSDWTVVNEKEGLTAKIKYLSADNASLCLYLYVELIAAPDKQVTNNMTDCLIAVGDYEVDEYIMIDKDNKNNIASGLLWFDLSDNQTVKLPDIEKFTFKIAPSWDAITVALNNSSTSSAHSTSSDSSSTTSDSNPFQNYCNSIAAKAQFLLLMKSAWTSSDSSSKTALIGLSTLYSGRLSLKPNEELTRQKTHDRWRRVIEFLHVHSKIRKQLSFEQESGLNSGDQSTKSNNNVVDGGSSEKEDGFEEDDPTLSGGNGSSRLFLSTNKDEISTAQAAIQACSVFVNSEDSQCSAENLCKLMKSRLHRANTRIHAFKILRSALSNEIIAHDPLLLFEFLVVVKNCIPPKSMMNKSTKGNDSNSNNNHIISQERGHYLLNLEGCSAAVLKSVQNAFAAVFNSLADTFNHFFQVWENSCQLAMQSSSSRNISEYNKTSPPAHLLFQALLMVLKMWTIQFSNRDYGWIVESSILPSLFKIISFSSHERILQKWYYYASKITTFDVKSLSLASEKKKQITKESNEGEIAVIDDDELPDLSLVHKDTVNDHLQHGTLCGRALLFHLYQFVSCRKFSPEDLHKFGLDKPFEEVFHYLNSLETSTKIYSQINLIDTAQSEAKENEKKRKQAELEAEEASKLKEELERLYPIGIFHNEYHADKIKLSEFNSVATLKEDRSGTSICTYCSIEYDLNNANEATLKGNYFEVTILSVGQGDAGIGFADRNHFSWTDNMPGWVQHSYGYHGDDGKKYGHNATPGEFPVFAEGDVIGCGFNFERKAIFYTRNGSLLGDGFTEVTDEKVLTPIIGFSNRHDDTVKLKINFGVEPFTYIPAEDAADEIIPNPKALEERERRRVEAEAKAAAGTATAVVSTGEVMTDDAIESAESEFLTSGQSKKEAEILSYKGLNASLKAVESQLYEYSVLRRTSLELVRYFLFLSSENRHLMQATPGESSDPTNDTTPNSANNANNNTNKDDSTPVSTSLANVTGGFQKPSLFKEISTFGTPNAATKADQSKMQSNITSALIHELYIGALYLNQKNSSTLKPSSFYSIEEKLLDYGFTADKDHDFALIEFSEVIKILYNHLTTLNIIMNNNAYIREELSHSNSLRTLFSLLSCASPEIHYLIMSILFKILPNMDPEIVEASIPEEWRSKLIEYENILSDWRCPRRVRRMPDSFIRILLLESSVLVDTKQYHPSKVYGFGDFLIRSSQMKFKLLQKLFATATWTEVIAFNISHAYKNAAFVITEAELWTLPHNDPHGGEKILSYAMISCGAITGLPVLIPGSKIEISNLTATVISGYDNGMQLDVIFDSNLSDFSCSKHVETIEREKIKLKVDPSSVDFSTISQPVLPHLFLLTKELLHWTINKQQFSSLYYDSLSRTKILTLGIILPTILSLIKSQTEVVMESLTDTNIFKELISFSTTPVKLPSLINFSDAYELWLFVQARSLEGIITPPPPPLSSSSSVPVLSRQVSSSKPVDNDGTEVIDGGAILADGLINAKEYITISRKKRQEYESVTKKFSEEFSLPVEYCQSCLEYAMFNEDLTRNILAKAKASDFDAFDAGATTGQANKAASAAPTIVFSDDSLLKGIEHAQTVSSEEEKKNLSILNAFKVEAMGNFSTEVSSDQMERDLFIMESSDEGLIRYNYSTIGLSQPIFVIDEMERQKQKEKDKEKEKEKEKEKDKEKDKKDKKDKDKDKDKDSPSLLFCDVMTKFYNSRDGLIYYRLLPRNNCGQITAFHHPLLSSNFQQFSQFPIDLCLAILSARNLIKNLLIAGYTEVLIRPNNFLSSSSPSSSMESSELNPISLMKLITSTDSVNIAESLAAICEVIPQKNNVKKDESIETATKNDAINNNNTNIEKKDPNEETSIVEKLVADVQKQLKDSAELNLNKHSQEENDTENTTAAGGDNKLKEGYRIVSAHPFQSPYETSGEIIIPSTWSGATITFNPKSRTPSEKAKLSFYSSKESYERNEPLHVFYGPPSSSNYFKELTFNSANTIFYKFVAEASSHVLPMKTIPLQGSPTETLENFWKITPKTSDDPVGLGEDDNLFNLFNSEPEVSAQERQIASIITDGNGVSSGNWYFEAKIEQSPSVVEYADTPVLRIGVRSKDAAVPAGSEFILGDLAEGWGLDGNLNILSNAEVIHPLDGSKSSGVDWKAGVTVGCALQLTENSIMITFLGGDEFPTIGPVTISRDFSTKSGIKPTISFSTDYQVSLITAQADFVYFEKAQSLSSAATPAPWKAFNESIGDEKLIEAAWGYDFVVKPVLNLNMQLHRDFELIWQPKTDENSGSKNDMTKKIWVWRAKSNKDYMSMADIITTSPFPPRRALLVDKNQCKPPKSLSLVWFSSKYNLAVWRLNPPDGFVAVGDVVSQSQSSPSSQGFLCLPKWAVKKCDVSESVVIVRKVGEGKTSTNASIWKADHGLGYFYGSPYEKRSSDAPKSSDFKFNGIPTDAYVITADIESLVLAEWKKESDIITIPSLTWSLQVLQCLISSEKWKHTVINDNVFKSLIHYLRASTAASPLEVIPTLILMVRQANKENISLSFNEMKSLSTAILKTAVDIIQKQKKTEISKALMRLVDLVVEIQIVFVVESGIKDRITISKNILKGKSKLNIPDPFEPFKSIEPIEQEESKEENYAIEEKESEDNKTAVVEVKESNRKWWDRQGMDYSLLKFHRLMKKENLVNLTDGHSEAILMKLKQVLKFLYAINPSTVPIRASSSSSTAENSMLQRSFPKLMTSKIWYENISLAHFIQSNHHPYREKKNILQKYSFPGSNNLCIYFDRRCSLNKGDKIIFTSGTNSYTLAAPITDNQLKKGIEFTSHEFTFSFEKYQPTSEEIEKDPSYLSQEEWGWAFVVVTSSSVFESAETTIDLEKCLEKNASLLTAKKEEDVVPSLEGNAEDAEPRLSSLSIEQCVEYLKTIRAPILQAIEDKKKEAAAAAAATSSEGGGDKPAGEATKTEGKEVKKGDGEEKKEETSSSLKKKASTSSSKDDDSDSDASDADAPPTAAGTGAGHGEAVGIDSSEFFEGERSIHPDGTVRDPFAFSLRSHLTRETAEGRPSSSHGPRTDHLSAIIAKAAQKLQEEFKAITAAKQGDKKENTTAEDKEKATKEPADPVFDIIEQFGEVIERDSIAVPHASELEIKIERSTKSTPDAAAVVSGFKSTDYSYLVKLQGNSNVPHRIKLAAAEKVSLQVNGSAVKYEVFCLLTERLNAIHSAFLAKEKPEAPAAEESKGDEKKEAGESADPVDGGEKPAAVPAEDSSALKDPSSPPTDPATSLPPPPPSVTEDIGPPPAPPSPPADVFEIPPEIIEDTVPGWCCGICTLMNPMDSPYCDACGAPNPVRAAGGDEGEGVGDEDAPPAAGAGWWCPVCTLINPLRAENCNACGSARVGGDAAAPGTSGGEGAAVAGEREEEGEERKEEDEEEEEEEEEGDDEDDDDEDEGKDGDEDAAEEESEEDEERLRDIFGSESEEDEEDDEGPSERRRRRRERERRMRREAERAKKKKDKKRITPTKVETPAATSTAANTSGDVIIISVKGKFNLFSRFEARLEASLTSEGRTLTPLQVHHRLSTSWTKECDEALLDYLNNRKSDSSSSSSSAKHANWNTIIPKPFLQYQGQALQRLTMLDIIIRSQILELFNKNLETLLPLIDLSNDDPYSLGGMIRKSNRYLLMKIKTPLLEKAISSTQVTSSGNINGTEIPVNLQLDNFKSISSRDKNEKDPLISQNCFVQAFKQLQKKDSACYRYIISGDRVFSISFADESGIDAGGVFREGISRIMDDLFSEHFNLLLLCPNGQQSVHAGMDKYLPNPKHNTPYTLEMFEFIGKLMAMSIRAKLYLPFEFPPLIWKKIVGEEVNAYDLMEIDMITCKQLDEIENCHKVTKATNTTTTTTGGDDSTEQPQPITNQELFYQRYQGKLKFVYISSDLLEKELILHGANKEVTFENRFEYCELVRKAKLNEFDLQIASIVKGMGQVIPMRALLLFSAKQLEELVCGNPKIDIEVWKANTEVSGVGKEAVNLFWKVMESLTPAEQTGFVRFAWGRSRLPSKTEDFQMKMRLTSGGRAALPVSHTCFFSVELPEYKTEEEMRHGLLTAIHYGVGGILNG